MLAITPGNTWTLTNLDSGKSITVHNTSSYHEEDYPDGTVAINVVGDGVWFNGNPLKLEPGFWYQRGQVSGLFDPDGTPISTKGTGSLDNLCPLQAANSSTRGASAFQRRKALGRRPRRPANHLPNSRSPSGVIPEHWPNRWTRPEESSDVQTPSVRTELRTACPLRPDDVE